MQIKDLLILIRAKLDLSQEALARELHVSFATINRWEKGHTIPSQRYIIAIKEFCKKNNITIEGDLK